jgi:hypothetical protein
VTTVTVALLVAVLCASGGQRQVSAQPAVIMPFARHAAASPLASHVALAEHLPQGTMRLGPLLPRVGPLRASSSPPGDFPFQTTQSSDGLIVIHSYGQYPSFGADFLGTVQQALRERVQPRLGYGLRARVDIYLYNSRADFLAGAQPDSPEITGAYSVFSPSQIYLPSYYDYADQFDILSHELTHITFHQSVDVGHLGDDFRMFPLWFDEGLAVSDESTTSPGYGVYRSQIMQSVRAGGRYLDIFRQFVWTYPQDVDTDDLAYAEAGAFLTWLSSTLGADHFQQFNTDARNGDLNTAAMMDFGADLQTLATQWIVSLGKPPSQHAAGVTPAQTTPTLFTPAHEPALAGSARPYGVGGGDDVLLTVLGEAASGTGAALLALGIGALWLRRKRRYWRALQSAPPLARAPVATTGSPPGAVAASGTIGTGPEGVLASDALATMDTSAAAAQTSEPWSTVSPAPAKAQRPQGTPWLEQVGLVLATPLALGFGVLWLRLDSSRMWRHAVLAAAVGALLLVITCGVLAWRAWRAHRPFVAQTAMGATLLVLAIMASTQTAEQAGMAQALGFERDGAYALTINAYVDAGATKAVLAHVHAEWAFSAYHHSNDYAVATAQYRAAIALEGNNALAKDNRAALAILTNEWGKRLSDAHEFKQAVAVFTEQLASPSCDDPCRSTLQEKGGAVYLAWVADLIAQKQPDAALDQLRALTRAFPKSQAAATAQRALDGEAQGLASAWAAQKAGDSAVMNLLLELVSVRSSDPLQVALASEAPQMVTGTLFPLLLYKTPIHLFFLGFRTASDAQAYMDHADEQGEPDLRVNTISTQADAKGAFVAWLPAGYVYLPAWEAPPEGGHDDYFGWRSTFITVQPFTEVSAVSLG